MLSIRPAWFLAAVRRASATLSFGRSGIEVTDHLAPMVHGIAQAMLDPDREDRPCELARGAFDQARQWRRSGAAFTGPVLPRRDHRIRKALKLLRERIGERFGLDRVAREIGLSRPHFHRLFRTHIGLTPNLCVNALRTERAIERLAATQEAVADLGFALGFSSQAGVSCFFMGNGVVPPSTCRRSVQATLHA